MLLTEAVPSPSSTYRVYRAKGNCIARTIKTPSGGHTATGLYAVELAHRHSNGTPMRGPRAPALQGANAGVLLDEADNHRMPAVRRLTPLECERLQGFPDGYTSGHSDTARYRMLGNAVMVPVAAYLGRRIAATVLVP